MDMEEQGQPKHFQSFPQQHPLDAEGIDPSALLHQQFYIP